MKRLITLLVVMLIALVSTHSVAQNITNYSFTAVSGTYTALSGGTAITATGGLDDGYANAIPIGFTFYYMGGTYTTVSVTTNGWLTFDQTLTAASTINNLTSGTPRPVIAPLWDDLEVSAAAGFTYLLSGTSPNRVLTIEWLNMYWNYTATTPVISFQAKLYETTGIIEFVYRQETAAVVSGSASIGICGIPTGSGTFLSLDGTGASPLASSTTETTTLASKPATGQIYRFTPQYIVTPAPPINLTFSSVGVSFLTVNWADNSTNETFFNVARSNDGGATYPIVTAVPSTTIAGTGSAYSLPVTGLNAGTTYFFRVTANNEASAPSAYIQGSQTTSPPVPISGNKNIPGDYASLTQAFSEITANGLSGNVNLILQSTYSSAAETFPILGPSAASVGSYTITVYPASTGLSITSANTSGTLDLNGSKNVIFDGRLNSTGSAKDLTIENTSTSGYAIRFINDANANIIKYCIVKGAATSTSVGVVFFSTTTGSNGNDNNTIDFCDIRDAATNPTIGIYSLGTTTSTAHNNSSNTISNCNIFNYYNSTSTSNGGQGINLGAGNTDWTISGNSFYQTAARTTFGSGANTNPILISNSTSGNNFLITGNYIGGSAPLCGGSAYTIGGSTISVIFRAMSLTVGSTTPTSVQGNTIQNIAITTINTSTAQSGISMITGAFNCGNVTGNLIGSTTSTGSISFVNATTSTALIYSGILAGTGSPGTINISNNSIGGIAVSTSSTGAVSVRGIGVQGAATAYTINNNLIGSTTVANNFTNSTNSSLIGIFSASSSASNTITNNTVANLSQLGTTTGNALYGFLIQGSSGGAYTTTDNLVRNLTSASASVGTGSTASIVGIAHTASTTAGQTLSRNTVYGLSNTTGTAAVGINGIHYGGPTTGTNVVARNFVYGLTLSTSGAGFINGINVNGGLTNFQNNMIAIGAGNTNGYAINGINDGVGTNNYYFNTVYVGGTGVAGTANSFAFNSSVTTNTRNFRNNIFFNARSNGSGTGKHYIVKYGGTTPNPAGLSADNNLMYGTGTGNVFGLYNAVDVATLAAWRTATGNDNNSINADPQLVAPTASTPDLHIQSTVPSPIESAGALIASVTDDFDGQVRADYTPTDIGADAGNFIPLDLAGPAISYTTLPNTAFLTNRTLGNVSITDASGVNVTAGTAPRIYFKRKVDANTYNDNTSTTNGWKYSETTQTASPFSFLIDYSLLFGGTGVAVSDTVQYFVVAQDLQTTPLVSINSGAFASAPASVNLTPAAFPITGSINYYAFIAAYSGVYNIGTGQTYTTLTADAVTGFFKAINAGSVTGNVTVNVVSDLAETGAIALNQFIEEPAGSNFTITIQPSAAVNRNISGSYSGGLIRLNGADRVIFDGRYSGSGKYLTISNTATSGTIAAIQIISAGNNLGATNNTVRNCKISAGNNTQTTAYGISVGGASIATAGSDNDYLTIQDNEIFSAYFGIYLSGNASFINNNLTITGNLFGSSTLAQSLGNIAVNLAYCSGVFSQNEIINIQAGNNPKGLNLGTGVVNFTCSRNKIRAVKYTGTGGYGGKGIDINTGNSASNLVFDNNLIYDISGDGWSTFSSDCIVGIRILGTTGGLKFYYNSVNLFGSVDRSGATTDKSAAIYIVGTATSIDMRDNIFVNSIENTTGVATAYAIYSDAANTAFTTINYNDYFVAGPEAMLGYLSSNRATLGEWQTATGQDVNSLNADPLFSAPTDLMPQNTSPVLAAGTPITGVDYDYMNADRSDTSPSIGAYENSGDFAPPVISYALLPNTTSTANRAFNGVTVTDPSGVNTTAGTKPRVYYKRATDGNVFNDNLPTSDGWKWTESTSAASPFDFTIDYSLLNGGTGVTQGMTVQYFVVAQDLQAIPNVGIQSGVFSLQPASVNLTAAAFPITGTINSYIISISYSGTINVGTAQPFTSLTADGPEGLFKALNTGVLVGNLAVNIVSDLTETGAIGLNQLSEEGAGNYTVTIQPGSASLKTVSGSYTGGLIRLNGADRVTIDGRYGGSGNYLSFINTATTGTIATLSVISLGNNAGAQNVTIRNCNISTGLGSNTSSYAISAGASAPGSNGADNDNLIILNNSIYKAFVGIFVQGTAATNPGLLDNVQILENSLGAVTSSDYLGKNGIIAGNGTGWSITGNTIFNIITTTPTPVGISLNAGLVSSVISRNNINNITYTGTAGYGGRGIFINTGAAASALRIDNNLIFMIGGDGYTSFSNSSMVGIYCDGTMGGLNIYYNSVYLSGSFIRTGATLTAAFLLNTSTITNVDLRNNIFQNSLDNTSVTTDKNYAIYSSSAASAFTSINYNIYYANGPQGILGYIGSADKPDLASWQTATGQDANSINADPLFTSTTDLNLNSGSPAIGAAIPIAAVDFDFSNTDRSNSNPTIGAYEVEPASCPAPSGLAAGSLTPHTANLSWTAGGSETSWEYAYGISPFPEPTGAGTATSSSTTNLISGLASATTYQFWVRANCGGEFSAWSGPSNFTTLVSCEAPTPLAASEISSTSAWVNWTPNGSESSWRIEVGLAGFTPGTNNQVTGVVGTSINPWPTDNTLSPSTNYQYYVQAICGFDTPKQDYFWATFDQTNTLLTGNDPEGASYSGGLPVDEPGEDGIFYFYDQGSNPWYNVWFYNGELDLTRMKIIRMGFWAESFAEGEGNISYVVNWSTDQWTGNGFPGPNDEQYIGRSPVNGPVTVSSTPQWYEIYYVIPDYNPEWVSVDLYGQNVRILYELTAPPMTSELYYWWVSNPQRGGIILHECLPKPVGDASTWAGPVNFTTLCAPVSSLPYAESFEGTWPPTCWTDPVTANYGWFKDTYGAPNTGSHWAYCNLAASELFTPQFTIPSNARMVFWYRAESSSYPQNMKVKVGSDVVHQITGAVNTAYQRVEIPLSAYSGQTITASFLGETGTGGLGFGICLDDVIVTSYSNTWTGAVNTSWNNPGNWSAGVIPWNNDQVTIPAVPSGGVFPVIPSGVTATCYNLVVQAGATVTVQTGGTLNVLNP